MKKRFLLSALTCGLLLSATGLQAKTDKKTLVNNTMQQEIKDHKAAPKEIVSGMQQTFAALQALQANKKEDAQKALEKAKKSFDAALKAEPSLDIVPVDERFQAYAFIGSSDAINARLKLTEQLLKAHDTQSAIAMLSPLKDELDITVISIPMKIYPIAVKKALELLKKGDNKGAFNAVAEAMNSLAIAQAIVPTPLLAAEDLIVDASKLDKEKKEDAKKLLEAAKEELKRAELLGYTNKHAAEYKVLNKSIEKIEKEIKGENKVEKLYETIKNDFKHLISKSKISKVSDPRGAEKKADEKVNAFQHKKAVEAKNVEPEFKKDSQADEKKTTK